MGISCRDCKHFVQKGENDKGRAYGICNAWGFSINENDGKNCKKFCADEVEVVENESD